MNYLKITPFILAQRFVGIQEVAGALDNNFIMAMLTLDADWPRNDETPWCSAFLNYICWLLRLPRSKSLLARSWLDIGVPVPAHCAETGWDIVILKRGTGNQPGPEDKTAPGHVGLYAGSSGDKNKNILILGGNQSNTVNITAYDKTRVLAFRSLHTEFPD